MTMSDPNIPDTVTERDAWTFECDECGLPFMQSFEFHNEEYHNGNLTE
jgi:hypothetical protein